MGEIAQNAGVSTATVSRVLNDPQRVRNTTREVVYEAMRLLDYSPPAAQRDVENLCNIIALFTHNLLLDSVTEMVRAVEYELSATRFDLLLVNMRGQRDFGEFMRTNGRLRKKIDGAIVFSANVSDQAVDYMQSTDTPIVLIQARSHRVRSVSNNNYQGGQDATEHLLSCGYRKIAFVGWQPQDDHVEDRLAGFGSTLRRHGLEFHGEDTAFGSLDVQGGYDATDVLMANTSPEAIFYAADVLALGGLQWLKQHNIDVPGDIGVMGFDDLAVAKAIGLSTMHQFFSTKARLAVNYLVGRLSGDIRQDEPEELQVSPRVVARETTRQVTENKENSL
ncbi:MAG: LacI family DNA-binding transcriptional regulator [Spirochaetaceae bacterium]|nr:LacI family DNA-binding transcriptional regulator [Spirochaetaceae bacterium]